MIKTITLKIDVENDVDAYFLVNKIGNLNFTGKVKIKEAKYNNKTTAFAKRSDRQKFLK